MARPDDELLRGVDLNLLRALLAVLDAGSVTLGAKRIGLTQSAMSRALDRLRSVLDDPLFVRSGRTVSPTPRAEALHAPLRRAFALVRDELLVAPPFSPETTTRRFTIEARDYADVVLLPPLQALFAGRAPRASLRVVRPELGVPAGELDLRMHPIAHGALPPHTDALLEEGFVVVGRKNHPALRRAPDAKTLARARHLFVAPEGGSRAHADTRLESMGLARDIALIVPGYTSGLARTLASSDLVAILPERVARAFIVDAPLRSRPLPFPLPKVRAGQSWHPRFERDPGATWLRRTVREVAQNLD